MKKFSCLLMLGIALIMSLGLVGCADIFAGEDGSSAEAPDAYTFTGPEYEIPALKGTIHLPDGYSVFESTDGFDALILPSDGSDVKVTIKVNDKIYDDANYAEIKIGEAQLYALNAVLGFGVADYDIIEGNGQRFFTFASKQDGDNVFTYATILDGHMVYVSMNTGDEPISEELQADLDYIAMSIQSEL